MPQGNENQRRQYQREYYLKNKEKLLAYRSQWAKDNPDSRRESTNKYAKSDRVRQKFSKLKSRYGITEEEYSGLLLSQNYRCAGCQEEFVKTPDVDHCHTTGKVRGLLCNNCNRGIGHLKENPETMSRLIKYLSE